MVNCFAFADRYARHTLRTDTAIKAAVGLFYSRLFIEAELYFDETLAVFHS